MPFFPSGEHHKDVLGAFRENLRVPGPTLYGLRIGLICWAIGVALAAGYIVFNYRRFSGNVKLPASGEGY
jgi:hypothetical protein